MKTDADILAEEMEALRRELIAKHYDLGMPASGQWMDTLESRTKRLRGQIWGEDYTEVLEDGRKPGKFPPIKAIEQWILDKNIKIEGKIKISSLAYLIARKIAKEGTEYFKQGGTDLISGVLTPARIQKIIDRVSQFHIQQFEFQFRGILTELAA